MIYVTIDTNVYINILLDPNEYEYNLKELSYEEITDNNKNQNTRNDEYNEGKYRENKLPKSLIPLKVLCDNSVIKLIVTEVTRLELEKQNSRCIDDIKDGYKKLKTCIRTEKIWNGVSYVQKDLENILHKNEEINIKNWEFGYKELNEFLQEETHIHLPLNADIICNLYRKNISGLLGNTQEPENATKNNDYLFINTVQEFLKQNKNENDHIFVVTSDKKDFRNKTKQFDDKGRVFYNLKENFIDTNVDIKVLANIESLYNWTNNNVNIENKIKEKMNDVYKQEKLEDESDDEEYNYIEWYNSKYRNDIIDLFNSKNKSLDCINTIRLTVLSDIKELLSECRKLESWSDRSEIKLYSWLEFHAEEELEIINLSELLRIRENMIEYKRIHLDML